MAQGKARRHPALALRAAEEAGRLAGGNLPAPECLDASQQGRPLNVYELHLLGARRSRRC